MFWLIQEDILTFLFFFNNLLFCRMFYLFFESRNSKKDPVVIWLTGGPGCSSELAVFYENGPFQIANNLSLVWNDYGWDKVLYVFKLISNFHVLLDLLPLLFEI